MKKNLLLAVLALTALALAQAYPQGRPYDPEPYRDGEYDPKPAYRQPQIEKRQAGYGYNPKPVYGRVKIQTYRGPNKGYGYDAFAPWGYYVTQPEDDSYGYH